jgi:hypothetical protein
MKTWQREETGMRHIKPVTKDGSVLAKAQLAPFYPLGIFIILWDNLIALVIERLKGPSLEGE